MATQFKVPASPTRTKFTIDKFMGVDLTNSATSIDERKSPNAPNMIRLVPTKVRKRMGYYTYHEFEKKAPVYGTHILHTIENSTDSVINKNRALGTSDSYVIKTVTTGESLLYNFGTPFFPTQRIYYDFHYSLASGIVAIKFGDTWVDVEPSVDGHLVGSVPYNPLSDTDTCNACYIKISDRDTESLSIAIQLKEFAVMYDMDSNFKYSVAPEDEGKTFSLGTVATISEKNVAEITSASSETTTSGVEEWTPIDFVVASAQEGYSFFKISFSATTITSNDVKISAFYNDGYTFEIYNGSALSSESISTVIPSNRLGAFFSSLHFEFEHQSETSETFTASFSDLKIYTLTQRTEFTEAKTIRLYHVGTELFVERGGEYKKIFDNMNEKKSSSWQFSSYIYIVDGKNFLRFKEGDESATDIVSAGIGTVPIVTIARDPSGGGISYQDRNLLQAQYEERFLGTDGTKDYQLSYFPLDSNVVTAEVMQNDGSFKTLTEGTDFSVNRTTGIVTFNVAPNKSPLDGEDNVYIKAYKTAEGYSEKIKNCTIGTMYGVNGASDRLFLSGNPNFPNYDWYSEINDPLYFADTSYSVLGSETSAIMGYSKVGNYLATFKDATEVSESVIIRAGVFSEQKDENNNTVTTTVFRIENTLQGAGTICKHSFGYLETEPLFLTKEGIFAITSQDITGEKYGQNRSFFLNGKLLDENNLDEAYCVNFDNYYMLAINSHLYLLDGLQPTSTDKSLPYATRQYVGFYCDNIPAYTLWVDEDRLWFGTTDGRVCVFHKDSSALESYNDNGQPISAWWETPELDGQLFYKNKTFRYLAVRLMSSLATSVSIYGKKHGIWSLLKIDHTSARYFAFSKIVFSKFSFSVDTSEQLSHTKVRIKKVDKARFKLENSELNEPFGIYDFALEYIESGNYKG